MRLNIGKYEKMLLSEEPVVEINTELNMSDKHMKGYRIYFEAYDLLALNAFVKRGSV